MNYLGMLIVTEDRPFVKSPPAGAVDNSPNLPHRGRGTAAAPGGEALNLPLRGRGTAAAVEEGRYGRERCEKGNHGSPEREARVRIPSRSRPVHPSSVSLTRASSTFCGIAATGSYFRFNSLRDAPPEGEAFNLPLRGRGTAAAVEEGRCGRERCSFDGIAIF